MRPSTAFRVCAGLLKQRWPSDIPEAPAGTPFDQYADLDLLAAVRRLAEAQTAAVILFYYAVVTVHDLLNEICAPRWPRVPQR